MAKTLPMVLRQTFKDYEIVLVDSGSTDGTLEFVRKFPVRVIKTNQPNPRSFNHARAFNEGAHQVKGEYLVRLSGDAVPVNECWLENLLEGLDEPKVAGTFSKYIFSVLCDLNFQIWFRSIFNFWRGGKLASLAGGSCAIKRSCWKEYPFNQNFGPGEDWEWGEVMRLKGYKILFNKDSLVFHEHRSSLTKQLKDFFHWLFIGTYKGIKRMEEVRRERKMATYA